MEYKKLYSKEEISEVIQWFKNHYEQLPESIYLDKAAYIPDLKRTVRLYCELVVENMNNPTYSGQIRHIFLMREAIEELWKKQKAGNL